MTTSLMSTAGTSNDSMPCRPRIQPMSAIAARMAVVRTRPAGGRVVTDRLEHERGKKPKVEPDRDHVREAQHEPCHPFDAGDRVAAGPPREQTFAVCDVETHRGAERVPEEHDAHHRDRGPRPDGRGQQGGQNQKAAPDDGREWCRGRPPRLRRAYSTGSQQPCARSQGDTNRDCGQPPIPRSIEQTCATSPRRSTAPTRPRSRPQRDTRGQRLHRK